jgi:hypothetical protein
MSTHSLNRFDSSELALGLTPREHALFAHASPRLRAAVARVVCKLDRYATAATARITARSAPQAAAAAAAAAAEPYEDTLAARSERSLPFPGKQALVMASLKAPAGVRLRRSAAKAVGGGCGNRRSATAIISRDELRFYGVD